MCLLEEREAGRISQLFRIFSLVEFSGNEGYDRITGDLFEKSVSLGGIRCLFHASIPSHPRLLPGKSFVDRRRYCLGV